MKKISRILVLLLLIVCNNSRSQGIFKKMKVVRS